MKKLLLLSNSTSPATGFLGHALDAISDFLGMGVTDVLFIPYASVIEGYDYIADKTRELFHTRGYKLVSIHHQSYTVEAINRAQAIVIGGGNTFHLLRTLQDLHLLQSIRERVNSGVPYIGWSAGANVACPTIKTTNDMPIVSTESLDALNLIPFQINPHYTDLNPPGFHGETRERRILEFTRVNPDTYAVGLPEGGMLRIDDQRIQLLGCDTVTVFIAGITPMRCRSLHILERLLGSDDVIMNVSASG